MLLEYIQRRGRNDVLWAAQGSGVVTRAGDILDQGVNQAARAAELYERNVALHLGSTEDTLRACVKLDGLCRQLFLLPADTTEVMLRDLLAAAGTDLLICDDPTKFARTLSYKMEIRPWATVFASPPAHRITMGTPYTADTRWIVATSGTTGTPKLAAHSFRSLAETSKRDPTIGASLTWGLVYDVARFAGLQVFLQAVIGQSRLAIPDRNKAISSQIAFLVASDCNALSATPTLWRKIVMTGQAHKLNLRQITLGGEIVDQAILNTLMQIFPQARITHIYASSETGVGFAVHDCMAGFPERYVSGRYSGTELMVNENGELLIRSSRIATKYLGNRAAIRDAAGFVNTGDRVELRAGRYFFLGRSSGVINVGGNKVHPEEIESILLAYPLVLQARVFGRASPITGQLVEASVIISAEHTSNNQDIVDDIKRHCQAHLPRFKVPVLVRIVEDLPVSAGGKQVRNR